MRRAIPIWLLLAMATSQGPLVPSAHAQTNATAAAVFQSQAALLRRVFAELSSVPVQRQLLDLWMADLLLSGGQGPLGAAGIEDVLAAGGLDTLQRLERGGNGEIAGLAMSLRSRLLAEVDVDQARNETATELDVDKSRRVSLKPGEYDGWLAIQTRPGDEVEIEAHGCPVLRAVAFAADRQRAIAGGTTFGDRLSFVSKEGETAFLRVRTPLCGTDGVVTVRSGPPVPALAPAPTKGEARVVAVGGTYRGNLADNGEQWVTFDAGAGDHYVVSAAPENNELDTEMYVYGSDGAEIASNDDDGNGLGSRLQISRARPETLRIKIGALSASGRFEFSVVAVPSPSASALPIAVGRTMNGVITQEVTEQWWSIAVDSDKRYDVETTATGLLDTAIAVFDSTGTTEFASDDDGGTGRGSRLRHANKEDRTLLIRVRGVESRTGDYRLTVSAVMPAIGLKPAPTASAAQAVSAPNSYQGSLAAQPQQWVRLDPQASRIYLFEAIPDRDVDTVITAYEADGTTEIGSDDDGGTNLGSRLEIAGSPGKPLLVKISRLDSERGDYELSVSDRPSPLELAKPAPVGTTQQGTLTSSTEEWWSVPVVAGTYVFEATPADSVDTVLAVFDPGGVEELDSDDNGGLDSGSRLEFANTVARTLLVKVSRVNDGGTYTLRVSLKPPPSEIARSAVAGMTYRSSLETLPENWWRLTARAGMAYVFEAVPIGELDTVITVYEADGTTEIDSDDDGGVGLGSRLEFRSPTQQTLFIRVHRLGGDAGNYNFSISESP